MWRMATYPRLEKIVCKFCGTNGELVIAQEGALSWLPAKCFVKCPNCGTQGKTKTTIKDAWLAWRMVHKREVVNNGLQKSSTAV